MISDCILLQEAAHGGACLTNLAGDEAIEDEWQAADERLGDRARPSLGDGSIAGRHPLGHVGHKATKLHFQPAGKVPAPTKKPLALAD